MAPPPGGPQSSEEALRLGQASAAAKLAAFAAAQRLAQANAANANKHPAGPTTLSEHSLFIGGLPSSWFEEQVKQETGRTSCTLMSGALGQRQRKRACTNGSLMWRALGHAVPCSTIASNGQVQVYLAVL